MEKRVRVWGAAVNSSIALHMNPHFIGVSVTVSRIFSMLSSCGADSASVHNFGGLILTGPFFPPVTETVNGRILMAAAPLLSTYQTNAPGWVESRLYA